MSAFLSLLSISETTRPSGYMSDTGSDGQASGGRKISSNLGPVPSSANLNRPAGNIIKGPVDDNGKPKDPVLLLGIKLDLEAEIHLTARIRGDITIGLY
ncbi:hypothetical protein N0V95_000605 [Ascochyta clinopodiicola]|nr:hypothetical protein N0V95_000605 [Ascochyta clinopodiicola]